MSWPSKFIEPTGGDQKSKQSTECVELQAKVSAQCGNSHEENS